MGGGRGEEGEGKGGGGGSAEDGVVEMRRWVSWGGDIFWGLGNGHSCLEAIWQLVKLTAFLLSACACAYFYSTYDRIKLMTRMEWIS